MQVDLVSVDRSIPGQVTVNLLTKRYNKAAESVNVVMPEILTYVRNFAGWYQDKGGVWRRPYRQTSAGQWEFYLDPAVEWAKVPASDEQVLVEARKVLTPLHNQEIVDHSNEPDFNEYVDQIYKVRVVPEGPVHIDPDTGMVQVKIQAFDSVTGAPLWVEDGNWAFLNLNPVVDGVFDARKVLRSELARRIREEQP